MCAFTHVLALGDGRPDSPSVRTPVCGGDVRCLYHPCTLGTRDELTSHRLLSVLTKPSLASLCLGPSLAPKTKAGLEGP